MLYFSSTLLSRRTGSLDVSKKDPRPIIISTLQANLQCVKKTMYLLPGSTWVTLNTCSKQINARSTVESMVGNKTIELGQTIKTCDTTQHLVVHMVPTVY